MRCDVEGDPEMSRSMNSRHIKRMGHFPARLSCATILIRVRFAGLLGRCGFPDGQKVQGWVSGTTIGPKTLAAAVESPDIVSSVGEH